MGKARRLSDSFALSGRSTEGSQDSARQNQAIDVVLVLEKSPETQATLTIPPHVFFLPGALAWLRKRATHTLGLTSAVSHLMLSSPHAPSNVSVPLIDDEDVQVLQRDDVILVRTAAASSARASPSARG